MHNHEHETYKQHSKKHRRIQKVLHYLLIQTAETTLFCMIAILSIPAEFRLPGSYIFLSWQLADALFTRAEPSLTKYPFVLLTLRSLCIAVPLSLLLIPMQKTIFFKQLVFSVLISITAIFLSAISYISLNNGLSDLAKSILKHCRVDGAYDIICYGLPFLAFRANPPTYAWVIIVPIIFILYDMINSIALMSYLRTAAVIIYLICSHINDIDCIYKSNINFIHINGQYQPTTWQLPSSAAKIFNNLCLLSIWIMIHSLIIFQTKSLVPILRAWEYLKSSRLPLIAASCYIAYRAYNNTIPIQAKELMQYTDPILPHDKGSNSGDTILVDTPVNLG